MATTAAKTTDRRWKNNIIEAQKMRGRSMGILYDRISLLVRVFEDDEFWNDNEFADDDAAAKWLDKEVDEFRTVGAASPFWTLRACLTRWPDKKDWSGTTLRQMLATLNKEREEAKEQEPKRHRTVATKKDLETAIDRAKYAETRAKTVEASLEKSETELDKAHSRIRELEEENAVLRGRISELERALSRQLVAA